MPYLGWIVGHNLIGHDAELGLKEGIIPSARYLRSCPSEALLRRQSPVFSWRGDTSRWGCGWCDSVKGKFICTYPLQDLLHSATACTYVSPGERSGAGMLCYSFQDFLRIAESTLNVQRDGGCRAALCTLAFDSAQSRLVWASNLLLRFQLKNGFCNMSDKILSSKKLSHPQVPSMNVRVPHAEGTFTGDKKSAHGDRAAKHIRLDKVMPAVFKIPGPDWIPLVTSVALLRCRRGVDGDCNGCLLACMRVCSPAGRIDPIDGVSPRLLLSEGALLI